MRKWVCVQADAASHDSCSSLSIVDSEGRVDGCAEFDAWWVLDLETGLEDEI
jgi:hypothetical protein